MILTAIEKNAIPALLLGKEPYYKESRSLPFEPQDFGFIWRVEIIPLLKDASDPSFPEKLAEAMHGLLEYEADCALGLYCLFHHLGQYYQYRSKGGTAELDLSGIETKIQASLSERKEELLIEKRWSGGDWNARTHGGNALWGILRRHAEFIKEKWGGPDFWPES